MNKNLNALEDIGKTSVSNIKQNEKAFRGIIFNYIAKVLFSYLPVCVYVIINIPYFKETAEKSDVNFFKGLFLALSYVFISQVNSLSIKKDNYANFLYSLKIFCGIICIALFASDKIIYNWYIVFIFIIISLITLFFTQKDNSINIKEEI